MGNFNNPRKISAAQAAEKEAGYPVWRIVMGHDNKPTDKRQHHTTGEIAVVSG